MKASGRLSKLTPRLVQAERRKQRRSALRLCAANAASDAPDGRKPYLSEPAPKLLSNLFLPSTSASSATSRPRLLTRPIKARTLANIKYLSLNSEQNRVALLAGRARAVVRRQRARREALPQRRGRVARRERRVRCVGAARARRAQRGRVRGDGARDEWAQEPQQQKEQSQVQRVRDERVGDLRAWSCQRVQRIA